MMVNSIGTGFSPVNLWVSPMALAESYIDFKIVFIATDFTD
jgi:hypothetical protein